MAAGRPGAETLALRWLARRPLTRRELEARLAEAGAPPAEAAEALDRLEAEGLLDDRKTALHYVVTRANRLALGRARLLAELEGRGVDAAVARSAWDEAVRQGHVDPEALARRAAAKRLAGVRPGDGTAARRVYNALLRAGFGPEASRAALEAHRPGRGAAASAHSERTDDDVP